MNIAYRTYQFFRCLLWFDNERGNCFTYMYLSIVYIGSVCIYLFIYHNSSEIQVLRSLQIFTVVK